MWCQSNWVNVLSYTNNTPRQCVCVCVDLWSQTWNFPKISLSKQQWQRSLTAAAGMCQQCEQCGAVCAHTHTHTREHTHKQCVQVHIYFLLLCFLFFTDKGNWDKRRHFAALSGWCTDNKMSNCRSNLCKVKTTWTSQMNNRNERNSWGRSINFL